MMQQLETARMALEARNDRSAWSKGVTAYALELLGDLTAGVRGGWIRPEQLATRAGIIDALKSGADDWSAYSWSGCALIYDCDIAERLCTPSELKRTRGGERRPNGREAWLDTQARALKQASTRVARAVMEG